MNPFLVIRLHDKSISQVSEKKKETIFYAFGSALFFIDPASRKIADFCCCLMFPGAHMSRITRKGTLMTFSSKLRFCCHLIGIIIKNPQQKF